MNRLMRQAADWFLPVGIIAMWAIASSYTLSLTLDRHEAPAAVAARPSVTARPGFRPSLAFADPSHVRFPLR